MLSLRSLFLALTLLVPTGALAGSVSFEVLTGVGPEYDFSSVHNSVGCYRDGVWYCGGDTRDITGNLTGEQDGLVFTDIKGQVVINNVSHKVSGNLDFSVAKGAKVGSIEIGEYGVFHFMNVKQWGPTNSYNGDEDLIALWGETVSTEGDGVGGWATDLGLRVSPAPGIPEPGAALVFGLGALIVGRASRSRRA